MGFVGKYASSVKQPVFALVPQGQDMPTVVCEVGLSETYPQLLCDLQLWMEGGAGNPSLAVLVEFNQRCNNTVAGYVEVFEFDANSPTKYSTLLARTVSPAYLRSAFFDRILMYLGYHDGPGSAGYHISSIACTAFRQRIACWKQSSGHLADVRR